MRKRALTHKRGLLLLRLTYFLLSLCFSISQSVFPPISCNDRGERRHRSPSRANVF